MNNIVKIVIKGSSGYCSADEAFNDKVTIAPEAISYEYTPYIETEINPKRKWSYKTNSAHYKHIFENIAKLTPAILNKHIDMFCTDIGSIIFVVTFDNKTRISKDFSCSGDEFRDYFGLVKQLVPNCEFVPAVLLTSDDYQEDDDEN